MKAVLVNAFLVYNFIKGGEYIIDSTTRLCESCNDANCEICDTSGEC